MLTFVTPFVISSRPESSTPAVPFPVGSREMTTPKKMTKAAIKRQVIALFFTALTKAGKRGFASDVPLGRESLGMGEPIDSSMPESSAAAIWQP